MSCGPVIISSRIGNPPLPWFYHNWVEVVRYVYFPEISIIMIYRPVLTCIRMEEFGFAKISYQNAIKALI